ncbi:hypothetical protein [Streptomyces sp. NRRL S-1868]|uniref:hypothetical protein n=1 Tax=Streptomyces sp. NRRL S-1868 TaxID=1463892 RepID=UPI00131C2DB4|nr:hypothetical protein [Streptomyces sp. NRRL S-1868]
MIEFPRQVRGDTVRLAVGGVRFIAAGEITVRGVFRAGRQYIDLTVPGLDPQERRTLEKAASAEKQAGLLYWVFREGNIVYEVSLVARGTHRTLEGLVISGSP